MSTGLRSNEKLTFPNLAENSGVCPICGGFGEFVSFDLEIDSFPDERPIYEPGTKIFVAHKCFNCDSEAVKRREFARKNAGIPVEFDACGMKDFDWQLYGVDIAKHKKFVESFIGDFVKWQKHNLGLFIWSRIRGSGKTRLACSILNELILKFGFDSKFVSVSNLLNLVKSAEPESRFLLRNNPVRALQECKILVLDDLGQQHNGKNWLDDVLFQVLDERMNQRRLTIFTSNLPVAELPVDDRVTDRINRTCVSLHMPETAIRSQKSTEEKQVFFSELGLV